MLAAGLRRAAIDLRQLLIYALCAASAIAIAWQAASHITRPSARAAQPTGAVEPKDAWTVVHRPNGAFDLPARELEALPLSYTVRRHPAGGRQDVLAFGDGEGSLLRVVIYRPAQEPGVPTRAPEVVQTLAGVAGFDIVRAEPGEPLVTKFGSLATVHLGLRGQEAHRACLGAGEHFIGSGLALAAIACNAGPETVERRRLACWLDRLTLLSAGGQDTVAAFFARSELQRLEGCGDAAWLAPLPTRGDWLGGRAPPKLRGALVR